MPIKIVVELIPKTCFHSNVRSQVSKKNWDVLRKTAYAKSNHLCTICHRPGRLEAHEIWHYNDQDHTQKLFDLYALCNLCHLSHHLGFAEIQGKSEQVRKNISKLNQWTLTETDEYIAAVFEIWFLRSQHHWHLDLTYLDNLGIPYTLVAAEHRTYFK